MRGRITSRRRKAVIITGCATVLLLSALSIGLLLDAHYKVPSADLRQEPGQKNIDSTGEGSSWVRRKLYIFGPLFYALFEATNWATVGLMAAMVAFPAIHKPPPDNAYQLEDNGIGFAYYGVQNEDNLSEECGCPLKVLAITAARAESEHFLYNENDVNGQCDTCKNAHIGRGSTLIWRTTMQGSQVTRIRIMATGARPLRFNELTIMLGVNLYPLYSAWGGTSLTLSAGLVSFCKNYVWPAPPPGKPYPNTVVPKFTQAKALRHRRRPTSEEGANGTVEDDIKTTVSFVDAFKYRPPPKALRHKPKPTDSQAAARRLQDIAPGVTPGQTFAEATLSQVNGTEIKHRLDPEVIAKETSTDNVLVMDTVDGWSEFEIVNVIQYITHYALLQEWRTSQGENAKTLPKDSLVRLCQSIKPVKWRENLLVSNGEEERSCFHNQKKDGKKCRSG